MNMKKFYKCIFVLLIYSFFYASIGRDLPLGFNNNDLVTFREKLLEQDITADLVATTSMEEDLFEKASFDKILKEVLPAIMLKNNNLDDIVNQYMETFYFLSTVMNNLKTSEHGGHLAIARFIEDENIYYLPYIFLSGTDIKQTLKKLRKLYKEYHEDIININLNLFANIKTYQYSCTSPIDFAHSERAIELYLKSTCFFNEKSITLQIITALPICDNCINFFQNKSYYIKETNGELKGMFCGEKNEEKEKYKFLDNLSSNSIIHVVNPESNITTLTPTRLSSMIYKLRGNYE